MKGRRPIAELVLRRKEPSQEVMLGSGTSNPFFSVLITEEERVTL